jgi:hypothetical protein
MLWMNKLQPKPEVRQQPTEHIKPAASTLFKPSSYRDYSRKLGGSTRYTFHDSEQRKDVTCFIPSMSNDFYKNMVIYTGMNFTIS